MKQGLDVENVRIVRLFGVIVNLRRNESTFCAARGDVKNTYRSYEHGEQERT